MGGLRGAGLPRVGYSLALKVEFLQKEKKGTKILNLLVLATSKHGMREYIETASELKKMPWL